LDIASTLKGVKHPAPRFTACSKGRAGVAGPRWITPVQAGAT